MNARMPAAMLVPLLVASAAPGAAQEPVFRVTFSEPLAVFEFVKSVSATAGDNPFKTRFANSRFSHDQHASLVAVFDKMNLDYTYEYTDYPYAEKIGGSTESLLKRNLIQSRTIAEFRSSSLGLVPNADLFRLCSILTEFEPVYRELVYGPNQETFEGQLREIRSLVAATDMK